MQNELKSAIRFNEFVAYFGPRGVLAMAWFLGAVHAERIRNEQNSYPFLQVVGNSDSDKHLLLNYLQKLIWQTPYAHALARETSATRAARIAKAGQRVVIYEQEDADNPQFDWDELKPLYNRGSFSIRSGTGRAEIQNFTGSIAITANQPLVCSDAVSSRMILLNLSAGDTHATKVRAEALTGLDSNQARAFIFTAMDCAADISSSLRYRTDLYQEQLSVQHGENLNPRIARNCAQMFVLLDMLCVLLAIPDDLRINTGHFIHDIASSDANQVRSA